MPWARLVPPERPGHRQVVTAQRRVIDDHPDRRPTRNRPQAKGPNVGGRDLQAPVGGKPRLDRPQLAVSLQLLHANPGGGAVPKRAGRNAHATHIAHLALHEQPFDDLTPDRRLAAVMAGAGQFRVAKRDSALSQGRAI